MPAIERVQSATPEQAANADIATKSVQYSRAGSDSSAAQAVAAPERYRSFTLSGGVDEIYTSNAFLRRNGTAGDFFTVMQVRGVWMQQLVGNLYSEVTVSQQFFRYAKYSELSINSLDAGAGLVYVIPELSNLSVFGRYNYNLITNASASSQIYHDQTLALGLQHSMSFGSKKQDLVYAGISSEFILEGWPAYALNETFGGYLGNELSITRNLKVNTTYQILYQPFLQDKRADWSHFLSASLIWEPLPCLKIGATASGIFNVSNDSYYSFNALNVGASLGAYLQF